MIKKISYLAILLVLLGNVFLIAFAPDKLSMAIIGIMLVIILAGIYFGILKDLSLYSGFIKGVGSIEEAIGVPSRSPWSTIEEMDSVFYQKNLDRLMEEYKGKIKTQKSSEQILSEIEEYMDEDTISLIDWNSVVSQIPGTLTGIGILGTFVGLLIGISEIDFNSVDAALESVQTLLAGIHVAFYTSISGLILSILFNILHRTTWNVMTREMHLFINDFHKNIIPRSDEQERYRQKLYQEYVLEKLDRLPKEQNQHAGKHKVDPMNERVLMPQIIQGLKDKEFEFKLQPKCDIHTRRIVSAEAIPVWKHKRLGEISATVFMPIVEENGFVTKINRYIWERVFETMHIWLEEKRAIVPIAINVSKMDILSDKGDISGFFGVMISRYNIPSRLIDIEIAADALIEAKEITLDSITALREKGFKVIIDEFDGNFVPINSIDNLNADELKLDLTKEDVRDAIGLIESSFDSNRFAYKLSASGVKSMEQVMTLRKKGCLYAQGPQFGDPVEPDEFTIE